LASRRIALPTSQTRTTPRRLKPPRGLGLPVAIPVAWVIFSGIIALTYQPWRDEGAALKEALRDRPLFRGGPVTMTVPSEETTPQGNWWMLAVEVENLGTPSRTKGWAVSVARNDGKPISCGMPHSRVGGTFPQRNPPTRVWPLHKAKYEALQQGELYEIYFHVTVNAAQDDVDRNSFRVTLHDKEGRETVCVSGGRSL
jgi:hypothetical protein